MSLATVSKAAGVSVATVSRVLNGHPRVKPELVEAVMDAMRRLGYSANSTGGAGSHALGPVSLRPQTSSVAVLFPDRNRCALRTPLSGQLLSGAQQALSRSAKNLLVSSLEENGDPPSCITAKQVDGVIIRDSPLAWKLEPRVLRRLPVVWVFEGGAGNGAGDRVLEDNEAIGRLAVSFLCRHPGRRWVMANPWSEHPSLVSRGRAFSAAAREIGAMVSNHELPFRTGNGSRVARWFLSLADRPEGIFVPGADSEVLDLHRELTSAGVRVGTEVQLISCVNDASRLMARDPTLWHIDIQAEEIGRAAADMLVWRLENALAADRRLVIEPRLVSPLPVG